MQTYDNFVVPEWEGYFPSADVDDLGVFDGQLFDFVPAGLELFNDTANRFVHWMNKSEGVCSSIVLPREMVERSVSKRKSDAVVCLGMI